MLNVQVLARQQIELLTAQAWLTENKDLEQKVVTTSYITLECLDGLLRSANFCPCILDLIVFFRVYFLPSFYLQIAQTSIQNGVISEYTRMILIETDKGKVITESTSKRKVGSFLIKKNLVFILDLAVLSSQL